MTLNVLAQTIYIKKDRRKKGNKVLN